MIAHRDCSPSERRSSRGHVAILLIHCNIVFEERAEFGIGRCFFKHVDNLFRNFCCISAGEHPAHTGDAVKLIIREKQLDRKSVV